MPPIRSSRAASSSIAAHSELKPNERRLFTSGAFACYSIRNREHLGSEEGVFPFDSYREMLSQIAR